MSIETAIGERVRQDAVSLNLKPPKAVVFCANYAAADYRSDDPRSHNLLRKFNATKMEGLAPEIIDQELREMFPRQDFNFKTVELDHVRPGSPEWDDIDRADLILISLATRNLSKGIIISKAFGPQKPVIVGGHHVTRNADDFHTQTNGQIAVVKGRSEGMFPTIFEAIQGGSHKGITFQRKSPFNAKTGYHRLPRTNIKTSILGPNANGVIVEGGVGCEGRCEFCAILTFAKSDRDPDQMIDEIERIYKRGIKYIMFADDNLSDRSPEFLGKVFTVINHLGMGWIGEGSRKILQDSKIAKIVGKNNLGFLHGIEDEALLGKTKDKLRSFDEIQQDIEALLESGFMVVGSVVLGLDNHTFPDTFLSYRDSILKLQIPVTIHVATPYPGTVFNADLKREGRIFDDDPAHYDNGYLVYHPAQMTEKAFFQGFRWLQREVASPERAARVVAHVAKKVGADKFIRVPRALASLGWLAVDQAFNGTDMETPDILKHHSLSYFNIGWDRIHNNR